MGCGSYGPGSGRPQPAAGGTRGAGVVGGPVTRRDGKPLADGRGRRSYVTSAGAGPSVGKRLLMAYLPPEQAVVGQELAVEYLNERYPVTVAIAGATPIFDPDNERIRS